MSTRPAVTREEFDLVRYEHKQLAEKHAQIRERMAASEAVQDRHGDAIQHLSEQVADLAREYQDGNAKISAQIASLNNGRSKIMLSALGTGSALSGGISVGLYKLIISIYPHFFGG